MRLYPLLTAVSCGALLVGCSKRPKSPGDVALANDPGLATTVSSLPVVAPMTALPDKVTGHGNVAWAGVAGGSSTGMVESTSGTRSPASSPTKGDLVPLRASAGSDVWLAATAPAGPEASDLVFTRTGPVFDAMDGSSSALSTAAIGIGGSAVGLGALLDVGGAWAGNASGDRGFSSIFSQALGAGFEGYHQSFSQANPTPSPEGARYGPPSWGNPGSYIGGGDNLPGGGPGGSHPAYNGPADNHNDDHHGNNGPGYDDGRKTSLTSVTATPEPGTVVLLATGFLALVPVVRRRRNR